MRPAIKCQFRDETTPVCWAFGRRGSGTCGQVAFVHFEGVVRKVRSSYLALEPYLAYHTFEMHKRDLSTGATPPSPKRPTNLGGTVCEAITIQTERGIKGGTQKTAGVIP